jgi:hypothetical protein
MRQLFHEEIYDAVFNHVARLSSVGPKAIGCKLAMWMPWLRRVYPHPRSHVNNGDN